jgi:hypothetical protein
MRVTGSNPEMIRKYGIPKWKSEVVPIRDTTSATSVGSPSEGRRKSGSGSNGNESPRTSRLRFESAGGDGQDGARGARRSGGSVAPTSFSSRSTLPHATRQAWLSLEPRLRAAIWVLVDPCFFFEVVGWENGDVFPGMAWEEDE